MKKRSIRLRNVRVNNLQGIDLDIPHGQWLAVCGLSGSGKSSLALDTLYAEGQRRYLDCLSPRLRQHINQLDKPDADLIEGLPPAIAVRRPRGKPDRQTTLADAAEILEPLRLLFSKIAGIICPDCQSPVTSHSPQSVGNWLNELPAGLKFMITFASQKIGSADDPFTRPAAADLRTVLEVGRKNGFLRAVIGNTLVSLDDLPAALDKILGEQSARPPETGLQNAFFVVDRLVTGQTESQSRTTESLETAFQFGGSQCSIFFPEPPPEISGDSIRHTIDGRSFARFSFSQETICPNCHRSFPVAEPKLFRFSNRGSACPQCEGVGFTDAELRVRCDHCHGARLAGDALAFQISGKTIVDFLEFSILEFGQFLENWQPASSEQAIAEKIITPLRRKIGYLKDVGLGYLTLGRPLRTLSTGEAQRVSLTTCLSSTLVNMLYVLDEPSVGLHSQDIAKLSCAIQNLNERGNTIVVVDHKPMLIEAATRIIEIGPGAGAAGGEMVFDGSAEQLKQCQSSVTGDFLSGRRGSSFSENVRTGRGSMRLTGARGHNLKNIDVEFPLNCLCIVSGVSGSGKSSLVRQTLYGAICQRKGKPDEWALPFGDLFGESRIDEVVLVDQSPIGRTARSNPVTYIKAFDEIRNTFADTVDAKTRNLSAGAFSFNVSGGRCDKCQGNGQITIDMQFLPDVHVTCDQCGGTRYRDSTLAVRYRGQNIADVLNLTVRDAFTFFRGQPKVQGKLKALIDVGLEYIRLGQSATTLSAGEAQRLKLAVYLNAAKSKRVLFLLEEPTTGLHPADVVRLVDCFDTLLAAGHSLVVVEHNLGLMRWADWIIDLGPGAGEAGGNVLVAGHPQSVMNCTDSVTGQYLKRKSIGNP